PWATWGPGAAKPGSSAALAADQAVALELAVKRLRADVELSGGVRLIAAVHLQRREDVLLFDLVERPHRPLGGDRRRERMANLLGQILDLHATAARERDRALHCVLELSHVARPLVAEELIGGAGGEAENLTCHAQRSVREQHPRERQHVVSALAQGRDMQL